MPKPRPPYLPEHDESSVLMSRGLGKVQRGILECLETYGEADYGLLAEHIYGIGKYCPGGGMGEPSMLASMSRAVKTLEKEGLVERKRVYGLGATRCDEITGCIVVRLVKC